ncbi:DinB superfamily protein [Psychrobacillus sp. OK028]|uniref:DinB family protein n=1 Tax=Psychrobacillus sp. OK028 TaxID=1884359 RepID=UPI00088C26F5|nr:DinB family protein [Psychrobacillus sp. OK028]SDN64692.1 DinB superfamily protein [Psychrobacillus sp. OK028]
METLNQLNFARIYTLGRIRQVNEASWDIQPTGFNNTIRWNVGHVYVNGEIFTQKAIPTYEIVHPEWVPLFVPGTKPSEWDMEPPTEEELVSALKEQTERIKAALENNLSNTLIESMSIGNLHEMKTVEALVQFMVWHEGVHAGIIYALNRATRE